MANVAFLGLGVMGYPMAGHLQAAGHHVTVYNRTASKAEAWVAQHGGAMAATPKEAARGAAIVFACVGNDDDLRNVCAGEDGAFHGMADGTIFVDHTTVSANVTRELFVTAGSHGIAFVDAPISGGQAGAENGVLSIMCGGDQSAYDTAEPVMQVYSKICRRMGDSGAGQLTKMSNQIAIASLVQGLSEALHFAEKAGLDGRAVVEVISQGAAGSWQMVNRHENHAGRSLRPRVCRGLDAQGSGHLSGRGKWQRGVPAGDGSGRSVLQGRAKTRRRSMGYIIADQTTAGAGLNT